MKPQTPPFDPAQENLEEGYGRDDPRLDAVRADEPADDEEEQQLGTVLVALQEWLYSEEGMANVVNMLNKGSDGELFDKIPKIVVPILEKIHKENPEFESSVYFGENGAIQQAVEMVFEIAEQEEMPGSEDGDQASASLINTFRAVGEKVLEMGDEASIAEAKRIGSQQVRTNPDDGTVQDEESYREDMKETGKKAREEQSQRGLLA